ncbi:hypothetical protein PENANT_c010G11488 [Penicillium antarcticum]|uniref:Uncharacterized protein n=1 Tax=Penicillium antarcticum TaxID=416450 RepID=A0A1V6Q9F0_9EURO|nr:hypothetical protein PENANT_c010G11488 [Penicillium antarcticum]
MVGKKMRYVILGYGKSYVLCLQSEWDFTTKFKYNLKAHDPDLDQFHKANRSIHIAIALDPTSTTNYILIWASGYGFGSESMRWICGDKEASHAIARWWNASN